MEKQLALHNLSLCICSLKYPTCKAHALFYVSMTCPAVQRFSALSHKLNDFGGGEKKVTKTKRVFWFSLRCLSETFLILRRNERDMIKMFIGRREKCPSFLSAFSKTLIVSTDFRKILKYKISWKSVQWKPSCSMRTERRTDMTNFFFYRSHSVVL